MGWEQSQESLTWEKEETEGQAWCRRPVSGPDLVMNLTVAPSEV